MKILDRMANRFSRKRLVGRARNYLELVINQNLTVYPRQALFPYEGEGSVVVLSPHADDETFGVGGTIALHVAHGDQLTVVLCSNNAGSIRQEWITDEETRRTRLAEFRQAMDALGVRSVRYLDLAPAELASKCACDLLAKVLVEKQPRLLYLPSIFDNHEDHRRVNIAFASACGMVGLDNCLVRAFEVWTPLPANIVIDISEHIATKRKATAMYVSQLASLDYGHHILGLNAYRAITFERTAQYAEAFLELPVQTYRAWVQRFLAPHRIVLQHLPGGLSQC
ncbi:MAG: PIG-L family deacetylase [Bacteroidota bacterium]|nr:PIG-L family deacetylase [Bacteroidota bacterium]